MARIPPQLYDMSDEDLMKHFKQGVGAALEVLRERLDDRLLRYVYRFVKDRHECEDIVQETWLRVYRYRFSYQPTAQFSTWLFTIAGNRARSAYQRRKRNFKREKPLFVFDSDGNENIRPIPANSRSVDEDVHYRMRAEAVHQHLSKLPEDFREVLILRDLQGLDYQEIADIVGVVCGTVKSRIHRGRKRLQKRLDSRAV